MGLVTLLDAHLYIRKILQKYCNSQDFYFVGVNHDARSHERQNREFDVRLSVHR